MDIAKVKLDNINKTYQDFVTTLNNLSEEEIVGNEGFLGDVLVKIEEKLYQGMKAISDFFNTTDIVINGVTEYATKSPDIKRLYQANKRLKKYIDSGKIEPAKLVNLYVPVLLGVNRNMEDLVNMLDEDKYLPNKLLQILNEYKNTIDELLHTKVSQIEHNIPVKPKSFDETLIKNIKKDLDNIIDSKNLVDRMKLGRVFKKVSNLPNTIDKVVELGKFYSLETLEKIDALNDEVATSTRLLVNNLEKIDLSRNALARLSLYIKLHAEVITAVSFVIFVYYQVVNMLASIIETIESKKIENESIFQKLFGLKKSIMEKLNN